jgi:membrane protein
MPSTKPARGIMAFIRAFIADFKEHKVVTLAQSLSYDVFMSLFPFVIFLMSLFSLLDLDKAALTQAVFMPKIMIDFISETGSVKNAGLLSLSLLFAINGASSGIRQIMTALGEFFHLKRKPGIVRAVVSSLILLLSLGLALAVSVVFFVLGDSIRGYFGGAFMNVLFGVLTHLAAVVLTCLTVLLINFIALDKQFQVRKLIPGALFTSAAWILASELFSFYVQRFNDFSKLYGSIAGIAILLIWINLLCVSLLCGAIINAIFNRRDSTSFVTPN